MISPTFATIIIISFILLFGVGIPVLNVKAEKFISYRWCVVPLVCGSGSTCDTHRSRGRLRDTIR